MQQQLVNTRRKSLAELKVMLSDRIKDSRSFYDKEIEGLIEKLESTKRGKARNEQQITYLEQIIAKREWKGKTNEKI